MMTQEWGSIGRRIHSKVEADREKLKMSKELIKEMKTLQRIELKKNMMAFLGLRTWSKKEKEKPGKAEVKVEPRMTRNDQDRGQD